MSAAEGALTDIHLVLSRLTRKGARLVSNGGTRFEIVYPGERVRPARGRDRPSRLVAIDAVAQGISAGWLIHDAGQGALRITEAGAVASRQGSAARSEDVAAAKAPAQAVLPRPAVRATGGGLSPLARLRQRRTANGTAAISSAQLEAGERLAADFERGQMRQRVTSNWERARLGFGNESHAAHAADVNDGTAAAQERVRRALRDAGPEFADLLIDVCCLELGLEAVEKRRGWPAHTGRVILGLGLDRLQRHYGIVAVGPPAAKGTHHWGDAGYRPTGSP